MWRLVVLLVLKHRLSLFVRILIEGVVIVVLYPLSVRREFAHCNTSFSSVFLQVVMSVGLRVLHFPSRSRIPAGHCR